MSDSPLVLRSSVRSSLKRARLRRGTLLGGCGAILLVAAGICCPPQELHLIGLPLFLLGVALMAWGLLPYRRLTALENAPHRLIVSDESLTFLPSKGNSSLVIPVTSIERLSYFDEGYLYGIRLHYKDSRQADLFFPYFSQTSYELLIRIDSGDTAHTQP